MQQDSGLCKFAQSSLLGLCNDKRTWKPAPLLCWETHFGSGGAQLLIRYLPLWYHAKPSLTPWMHWTVYPTSLHGSLCPSETSSCLWVGNQWQMQLMSQKLTMVIEHNKAPQNVSTLSVVFFPVLSVCCLCHWGLHYLIFIVFLSLKKILFLYCLIGMVSFSGTNIIFLQNSNKCKQMHSWNNLYNNHTTTWRNRKIGFQSFLSFLQYPHLL